MIKAFFLTDLEWFALEFVRAMRKEPKAHHKASLRQSIAIGKLCLIRYLRTGHILEEDLINIAVITSPLEDQSLAQRIAERLLRQDEELQEFNLQKMLLAQDILMKTGEVLSQDEQSHLMDEWAEVIKEMNLLAQDFRKHAQSKEASEDLGAQSAEASEDLGAQSAEASEDLGAQSAEASEDLGAQSAEASEDLGAQSAGAMKYNKNQQMDYLNQELGAYPNSVRQMTSQEQFFRELEAKKHLEPFRSFLDYLGGVSQVLRENIESFAELESNIREQLQVPSEEFSPPRLEAAKQLGLIDELQNISGNQAEQLALDLMQGKPSADIFEERFNQMVHSCLDAYDQIKDLNDLPGENLHDIQEELRKNLPNHDLRTAWRMMRVCNYPMHELSMEEQQEIIKNSMESMNYNEMIETAQDLDKLGGTNFEELMQHEFNESMFDPNVELDELLSHPQNNKFWREQVKEKLLNEKKDLYNHPERPHAGKMKDLLKKLQQDEMALNSPAVSNFLEEESKKITQESIEASSTEDDFFSMLDFASENQIGLDGESVESKGKNLEIPSHKLAPYLKPSLQAMQEMIEAGSQDRAQYERLMKQLDLSDWEIKDLVQKILDNPVSSGPNFDALVPVAQTDLREALRASDGQLNDQETRALFSQLSAGGGENLLKQWYLHRDYLPASIREALFDYLRALIIQIADRYANSYVGSATCGPITQNRVRPFQEGDEFEIIDLEETIQNLMENGTSVDHISMDDFLVNVTEKGLRQIVIELDISGSMSGQKLAFMAISTIMLIMKFDVEELAISLFESDNHVIKNLGDKADLDQISQNILDLEATGGTCLSTALEWADKNFKDSQAKIKYNVMFSDAEIFDFNECVPHLESLKDKDVEFVLVVPAQQYSGQFAKKFEEITDCTLLELDDWENFPKLFSDLFAPK